MRFVFKRRVTLREAQRFRRRNFCVPLHLKKLRISEMLYLVKNNGEFSKPHRGNLKLATKFLPLLIQDL
jgi:hypothetical protein